MFCTLKVFLPLILISSPLAIYLFPNTNIANILREGFYEYIFKDRKSEYINILGDLLYWLVPLVISIIIIIFIRRINKDKLFNNWGKFYADIPFSMFWIAGKLLNYGQVNLIGIPVHLQFKIVIYKTFRTIDAGICPPIDEESVEIKHLNWERFNGDINLILSDTYKVELEKIPKERQQLPTIVITRKSSDRERKYSPKFINAIQNEFSNSQDRFKKINLFAYTNTKHTFEIASNFYTIGRSNLDYLMVHQPERETFNFTKCYKIKL